jgi:hypothetical protein
MRPSARARIRARKAAKADVWWEAKAARWRRKHPDRVNPDHDAALDALAEALCRRHWFDQRPGQPPTGTIPPKQGDPCP